MQVRLHLPTLAGLEELPQPSVSKADDHRVDERKANATECQLSIYTPASPNSSRRAGGANRTNRVTMVELASLTFAIWNQIGEWLRRLEALRRVA